MESKRKHLIGLTVIFAVIGVGLLVTSFATDNWVSATPRRDGSADNSTSADKTNTTNQDQDVNTGNSSFGLFNGKLSLKYTTGPRSFPLQAACDSSENFCAYIFMRQGTDASDKLKALIHDYKNSTGSDAIEYGLFSFPLWVSTLTLLSLSIVMGLVTIGFSIFNVFGRPIETITGPMGLYLWNGLSLLFTAITLTVFGVLYGTELSVNFLMHEDYFIGFRSKDHTSLDFSFFLIIGAAGAFIVNFILLYLSGQSLSCSYAGAGEKEVDNGMILY